MRGPNCSALAKSEVISTVYGHGLLRSYFDWTECRGKAEGCLEKPDLLAKVDIATIQKLFVMLVRQGRLCSNCITVLFENGHNKAILERLKEIGLGMKP